MVETSVQTLTIANGEQVSTVGVVRDSGPIGFVFPAITSGDMAIQVAQAPPGETAAPASASFVELQHTLVAGGMQFVVADGSCAKVLNHNHASAAGGAGPMHLPFSHIRLVSDVAQGADRHITMVIKSLV